MLIKFQKEGDEWFAVLPTYEGPKENLQMVGGADTWLDILSGGELDITLELSDKGFPGSYILTLDNTDSGFPELGATYRIGRYKGIDYSHLTLWLCPVTIFVFGEYPKTIHYL